MSTRMSDQSTLTPKSSVPEFVASNSLFYSLTPAVIDSIAEKLERRAFNPEDVIVSEGELGDCFYIIRSGHVRVVRQDQESGEELVLSELGPGEGFGEMALVIDQPRSATVKAINQVDTLVLNRDDFTILMRRNPELAEKMNRLISERVSLLESVGYTQESRGKFLANRTLALDYSYLDLLMKLNEAAGGATQVEHCKETGQLAREMSKMLCPMVSEEILFAGYLHEIGKVALPRELVERERTGGKLSEEEQARMGQIFEHAVTILQPNRNLHDSIRFLAHLGKSDFLLMPLEAQILKVADDYLMLRNLDYRGKSEEEALAQMTEGAGTLYNPRVVAALEKNVRKYRELRAEAQLNVMRMMVVALDLKDDYTYRHSMDVRDMALTIAERLGCDREQMEYLRIGSELHDVGKIFIDEAILNAPRKLTDEEFEIMKTHAARSADFFHDIPGMDDLVAIVRAHHEKWNGRGYPDGLSGEDIPLLARVMTVADVWSALTTPRVYRLGEDGKAKRFTPQKALSIMEEMSDGHFDPSIFPVFREIIGEMISAEEEAS